jgi:tryptophan halogenase
MFKWSGFRHTVVNAEDAASAALDSDGTGGRRLMDNHVTSVTIVGGGTAGWLTALMMQTMLNRRAEHPAVHVTLIESPNIPTVGVGEATVPGMPRLLQQMGINESEYMLRCNATFKCGVRFADWSVDKDGTPITYLHPFNSAHYIEGLNPALHFHHFEASQGRTDLTDGLVPNKRFIERYRGPRQTGAADYDSAFGYAYHLDAGLFAQYLREVTLERGVTHILDDVKEVRLDERGFVSELELAERGTFPIEFVIDCSGFRGLIINKALGEPFVPWGHHLLCDRALAVQVPHTDIERLDPCTTSTALGAGWVWNVPLYTRIGTGYVFSSTHRSDDEAWDEFRQYLTAKGLDTSKEPRAVSMRVGRTRNGWVKNCVAIGLSSGFVEPLESTAIYIIEMSARMLLHHFPDKAISPTLAKHYNAEMAALYDEILSFIVMHYVTSNRTDSQFWVDAREGVDIPQPLQDSLEFWKYSFPGPTDTAGQHLFNHWNYLFVLYAKGYFDGLTFPQEGSVNRADWDKFCFNLEVTKDALTEAMPSHYELVTDIRKSAEPKPVFSTGLQMGSLMPGGGFQPTVAIPTASVPLPKT